MSNYIGIDLGGTAVKLGIVNMKGEIVETVEVPTLAETNSADKIYRNISQAVGALLEKSGGDKIKGIGIGCPGSISPEEGTIVSGISNIPALNGFPLAREIEHDFKIPTFIDNDANNAARGEFLFGAGTGKKNFIMITLGTGIGGAIFINGDLYGGVNNYAGEVGHMIIIVNGLQCTCGSMGCWEAYGSATSMIKRAKALVERGIKTSLLKHYPDDINAKVIVKEAAAGDMAAKEIIISTGKYIGIGLANLINIFNPELCIVGGGVSLAGEILFKEILKYAQINTLPRAWDVVEIEQAKLGNKAGILGSAALAYMKMK
ncbi:MAG: hypothetical protein A2Y33_12990 [Spirochaetes bacterium GWF1_51_8]|nr:MAG: hypothetical protein A2Y33_12990 [Spirochaetes bacterium GWF1_51_8]